MSTSQEHDIEEQRGSDGVNVAVVFHSGSGRTAALAQAVIEGARSLPEARARLVPVAAAAASWDVLAAADAIVFGAPTYMGSASAPFKAFMDATLPAVWRELRWRDKLAAGFTCSGCVSGDKLHTLTQLAIFAMQHGMIWVGLDLVAGDGPQAANWIGSWIGAMAQSAGEAPTAGDLLTAAYLGRRVATLAGRRRALALPR